MNLMSIFARYPDQEACIAHLEKVRWGDDPHCPYCGCVKVGRKQDGARVGRWNCHGCKASFNALSGTIFEKTKIPLQKWFLGIGLMVNAKKSLSSCQLARDLEMNQKSAWYMQQRIRVAMLTVEGELLQGIVEADETYVGGKPRKGNRREDDHPNKRGRGTNKTPVIGAVERGGRVVAQAMSDLSNKAIMRFIKNAVDPDGTILMTDEARMYRSANQSGYAHAVINHSVAYADGMTHTNTIEGFWSLIKRSWYGSHHHYSREYTPLFVAETVWKYNHRGISDGFNRFIRGCFS